MPYLLPSLSSLHIFALPPISEIDNRKQFYFFYSQAVRLINYGGHARAHIGDPYKQNNTTDSFWFEITFHLRRRITYFIIQ